jgi:hypothetical protein
MVVHTSSGEPSLAPQSSTLHLLSRWLSPLVQRVRLQQSLQARFQDDIDRFEATLSPAFDNTDTKGNEQGMRVVAYEARAVYDADGNSAMSSVSEDIDVFGGDQGGRLVIIRWRIRRMGAYPGLGERVQGVVRGSAV